MRSGVWEMFGAAGSVKDGAEYTGPEESPLLNKLGGNNDPHQQEQGERGAAESRLEEEDAMDGATRYAGRKGGQDPEEIVAPPTDEAAEIEFKMPPFMQVVVVVVVGLNSAYWTCFFPIQYEVASWLGQTKFFASVMVGVLFAPFPFASAMFKWIMRRSRRREGDARDSYAVWTGLVMLGSGGFTACLFFPDSKFTPGLIIVAQLVGGASQAIIYVCRQIIVLTTSPKTRVFYYALYTGSNDFGAGFGILLTGLLGGFAGGYHVINGTPLKLTLPTACICVATFVVGVAIQISHPRHPRTAPEHLRQLQKPPPASVKEAYGLSADDRKRLCIVACYVVGFNRVVIKTMWFSISLNVFEKIFDFSTLHAAVSVFAVITLGVVFQQAFAYGSHLLPDRLWMQLSELGLFFSLGLALVVDKLSVVDEFGTIDTASKVRLTRLLLYYVSCLGTYLACQINANVANVFATKYAISKDPRFDQPAVGFWQTVLQNCLAKLVAPIIATALWAYNGFTAYNVFSLALAFSTILFSNIFILGSDDDPFPPAGANVPGGDSEGPKRHFARAFAGCLSDFSCL